MPCWEVNLMSVEFKVKHIDLLKKAAESLNFKFNYNEQRNEALINGMEIRLNTQEATNITSTGLRNLNKLKVAYSEQALMKAAKKKKWIFKKKHKQQYAMIKY